MLPCKHVFHCECLNEYIEKERKELKGDIPCPPCKAVFPRDFDVTQNRVFGLEEAAVLFVFSFIIIMNLAFSQYFFCVFLFYTVFNKAQS